MRFRPTIIVLAAGSGSRFGGPVHKLAQSFGGSTVLGQTVAHAVQTQLPVLVVTTAGLVPLVAGQMASRDILVLSGPEAARGMGDSIAAGVAERSGAPGWLILPGDMPLVQPGTLLAVATALEQYAVVHAEHRGRRGHPVGFAAELYSELVKLQGDEGARRIIARYPAHGLEVADRGVLLDVDTAADLQALRSGQSPEAAATPAAFKA
jgi:molybdenum cofactor cytidylyltransferase